MMNDKDLSFVPVDNPNSKLLSREQIEQYNEDGYLKPFRIFDEAGAAANREYFDSLMAQLEAADDGRDNYSINGYHRNCNGIYDMAVNPLILDYVEDLLGPDFIAWGTHFFCKLPYDEKKVPWHQDASYWPFEKSRTVTVWLAIDDAEFDISYLEDLLRSGRRSDRGRARFLLDRNQHLARSLRTRHMRWRKSFRWADGMVEPSPGAERALQAQRLRERSYSPTALQNFAACPYKFLLSAIHRLRPRDEITSLERMDPLTRGSLFHDAQYELHKRLRDAGELPATAANLDRVTQLADTVLDEVAEDYRERLAPAIERVWRDEVEGLRTDLRGWIRAVGETETDWLPTYFEFSFGLGKQSGRDPLSHRDEAVIFDGYRLRGAIDLVESDTRNGALRMTDHKTGKAYWKRFLVVGGGEVLQPMLYALAAESHLDEPVAGGRLFYCTRRGGFETREVELNADNRRTTEQVLDMIDGEIERGFLPAAPKELSGFGKKSSVCKFCDYQSVCGPYELSRVANKDQTALNRLRWLRDRP